MCVVVTIVGLLLGLAALLVGVLLFSDWRGSLLVGGFDG